MPNPAKNRAKLTQRLADSQAFPEGVETFIYDKELTGFALRVQANGKRKWIYRSGSTKHTLGDITEINEKDARLMVAIYRAKKRDGVDAVAEKREKARARKLDEGASKLTAGYCFRQFMDDEAGFWPRATESHRKDMRRMLTNYVLVHEPVMKKPINMIDYIAMAQFVNSVPESNGSARNKLIAAVQGAFKYFRKNMEILEIFGRLPTPDSEELRALPNVKEGKWSLAQLRTAYAAAARMANERLYHSLFFRFLILCPRRVETVRLMEWDHLNFEPDDGPAYWRIPAEFNKKGRDGAARAKPQNIALKASMIDLLRQVPRSGKYVFGGERPRITQPGRLAGMLRNAADCHADEDGNVLDIHAIRKTMVSSSLAAQNYFIIEVIQGRTQQNKGTDRNYYQGDYLFEQLEVLQAWEKLILPDG